MDIDDYGTVRLPTLMNTTCLQNTPGANALFTDVKLMANVLLLEGPDGCKYIGTKISGGAWYVEPFLSRLRSKWWREQSPFVHWRERAVYSTSELEETFSTLAASETEE